MNIHLWEKKRTYILRNNMFLVIGCEKIKWEWLLIWNFTKNNWFIEISGVQPGARPLRFNKKRTLCPLCAFCLRERNISIRSRARHITILLKYHPGYIHKVLFHLVHLLFTDMRLSVCQLITTEQVTFDVFVLTFKCPEKSQRLR